MSGFDSSSRMRNSMDLVPANGRNYNGHHKKHQRPKSNIDYLSKSEAVKHGQSFANRVAY